MDGDDYMDGSGMIQHFMQLWMWMGNLGDAQAAAAPVRLHHAGEAALLLHPGRRMTMEETKEHKDNITLAKERKEEAGFAE